MKKYILALLLVLFSSSLFVSHASANFRFMDGANYDDSGKFLYSDIDWKSILEKRGIHFLNDPSNPDMYRIIDEAFVNFPDNKIFNFSFANTGFACQKELDPFHITAVGCYTFSKNEIQTLGDTGSEEAYKFIVTHEYGHLIHKDKASTPAIECAADAFAKLYYPNSVGAYNCN